MKLSPRHKLTGLFVYCNKHKQEVKDGKCYSEKCKFPERHVFKLRVHVKDPLSRSKRQTRVIHAKDSETAYKMAFQIRENLKENRTEPQATNISEYVDLFLHRKRNPGKNQPPTSEDTIRDYKAHLDHFLKVTYYIAKKPHDINLNCAQVFFDSIKHSGRTKQKYFSTLRNFYNWLIKEGIQLPSNPFNGWNFDKEELKNEVITAKEFGQLLSNIKKLPQRGHVQGQPSRQFYFDWLEHAFRFALYTGARRQEIPLVKWSDVQPKVILLRDIKHERIKKKSMVIKPIFINDDLKDLLKEVKKKGEYLFGNEIENRKDIEDILSRSFRYYVNQDRLSFKCLRKTWFTAYAREMGVENASKIGGHSSKEVTAIHYVNKIEGMGKHLNRIFK